MRTFALCIAFAAALGAAGCASYDGRALVPGQSTARDVEALMGPPAERLTLAGGDSVWFYPRQPFGLQTYAVRLSREGVVRGVEPRLTEENVARLVPGTSTKQDVRELLGPPWQTAFLPRQQREVWGYKMENRARTQHDLYVQFSADGIVREVLMVRDIKNEVGGDRG
jgi:hypothetical protein